MVSDDVHSSPVRRAGPEWVATWTSVVLGAATFCAVFVLHARWLYTHFSVDGYLYDSGWLAYLFGAGDPWLGNPAVISNLSFHAHHLSPHIFLFGAPLARLFGLSGPDIFAIHQGFFFGLFSLAVFAMAVDRKVTAARRWLATAAALVLGVFANPLLQAAAYPHYEIAMHAITVSAIAAWMAGRRPLFAACLLWLPLVREDGGLYAAFACLFCAVLSSRRAGVRGPELRALGILAMVEVAAAALAFSIKAWAFPGFDAFAMNYAGEGWAHLSTAFVVERLQSSLSNPNVWPVLLGSAVLAAFDPRYAAGVVLLAPLYALHLLSVRPEHGNFTLYYALPWALAAVTWLALAIVRARQSLSSIGEWLVVTASAMLLSAPFHAATGARGQFWYVARWAFERPVANLGSMREFALWVRRDYVRSGGGAASHSGKECASMGIAALIPNEMRPDELVDSRSDISRCRTLLLQRADIDYGALVARAEAQRFRQVATRQTAELWMRATD